MMWHETGVDGTHQIGGYGFLPYPKEVRSPSYWQEYENLALVLSQWGSSEG